MCITPGVKLLCTERDKHCREFPTRLHGHIDKSEIPLSATPQKQCTMLPRVMLAQPHSYEFASQTLRLTACVLASFASAAVRAAHLSSFLAGDLACFAKASDDSRFCSCNKSVSQSCTLHIQHVLNYVMIIGARRQCPRPTDVRDSFGFQARERTKQMSTRKKASSRT